VRLGLRRRGARVAPDRGHRRKRPAAALLNSSPSTTKTTGTGLGLAYAKKVVEGMNGTIGLANRGDEAGAVLTVLLPRARS
jgi:signal transduction histidine kinase